MRGARPRAFLTLALVMAFAAPPVEGRQQAPVNGSPSAPYRAAIVLEPSTMTVLHEHNARESLPTASMIKLLTVLVALEALDQGEIRWRQRVEISSHAERVRGTSVYLRAGEVHTVEDLIRATMVHSANDAAVALAETVAGSEDEFVERMRRKARLLGLTEAEIHTPNGLPTSETGKPLDRMNAWELALLGAAAMERPELMRLARIRTAPFPGREFLLFNPNHLLRQYSYASGLKTGYTKEAGFCLVASARRCDMDLIAVVIGSRSRMDRFAQTRRLLEDGFARYRLVEAVEAGEVLAERLPLPGGNGRTEGMKVAAAGEVRWLTSWDDEPPRLERILVAENTRPPVTEGQPVGKLIVREGDRVLGEVPLVAAESVGAPRLWQRLGYWASWLWASLGRARA
jgi:serine-type D-Ala-D-Ala carboxypeptidase (penicillin-binding protein 5/6)